MIHKKAHLPMRLLPILASLALAVTISSPTAASAQPKLKVGILHIGSIADAGYNQAHAEGVQVMKKTFRMSK